MSLLPAGCAIHWASQRGPNGELPWLSKFLGQYRDLDEVWKDRNAVRSEALRQAAFDRLLLNTAPREKHYEMRYPEYGKSAAWLPQLLECNLTDSAQGRPLSLSKECYPRPAHQSGRSHGEVQAEASGGGGEEAAQAGCQGIGPRDEGEGEEDIENVLWV
jgi:hypothetical protein